MPHEMTPSLNPHTITAHQLHHVQKLEYLNLVSTLIKTFLVLTIYCPFLNFSPIHPLPPTFGNVI